MLPYLFHIGPFQMPTFGLTLFLAAVAAAFMVDRGFKRARITADAPGMVAIAVVAGIVGAKLWHVLDSPDEFQMIGWRVLWDSAGFRMVRRARLWHLGAGFPGDTRKNRCACARWI